eukprot:jgi/Undpi1/3736/HiC_scaffold_16.g07105.m1
MQPTAQEKRTRSVVAAQLRDRRAGVRPSCYSTAETILAAAAAAAAPTPTPTPPPPPPPTTTRTTTTTCCGSHEMWRSFARGKRATIVCKAAANPPNTGRCKRNCEGGQKRKGKSSAVMREMGEAKLAEVGTGNHGSDDDGIGGGVDDLATNGAFAAVSVSRRKREDAAKLIPEEDHRQAYLDVFELKKKDKAADQSDPALHNAEDMDDEEDHGTAQGGWKSEGLKENDSKDAYERRNKHKGGDSFGLAEETKRVLPGLDRAGLDALRNAVKGKSCAFPAMFFDLCFPKKVTEYVGFCTTPSDRRQARHEAKTTTKGHCEVPKIIVDGTEVERFGRMHAYGVMGILITMGITQKRRMADHWGVSLHDNYPFVRSCMPRDLLLLFYSRFLHMASAAPVGQDHPKYDAKHHIREFEDLLNTEWSTIVTPGAWLSFDEQMIKSTAVAMRGILRFNPLKPMKHGIARRTSHSPTLGGALQYWKENDDITTNRGDMLFARNKHLTVVEWMDSKVVHFMSSMHIFERDFVPLGFK